MNYIRIIFFIIIIFISNNMEGQLNVNYQKPPKAIADLVTAPATPLASLSPDKTMMLLLGRPGMPSIEEVAQEELRLAGLRINPKTNGSSRSRFYNNMTLKSLSSGQERIITGLPAKPMIENVSWAPDASKIVFTITKPNGLEMWLADTKKATAKRVTDAIINDAMSGLPYRWISESSILFKSLVEGRGEKPRAPIAPKGPSVQENTGEKSPVRTYQDLLKNKYDEELFKYFATSQLKILNTLSGRITEFGEAGMVRSFSVSPDSKYILLQSIKEPFSYLVPYSRFPLSVDIFNIKGQHIKQIADVPLSDNLPKGFGATRKGPRSFTWRADAPSTLYWTEAQDDGDPKKEAEFRDQLFSLKAPFQGEPAPGIKLNLRYGGIDWGDGDLAIVYEWEWKDRREITSFWKPDNIKTSKEVVYDRSWQDRYTDPGRFRKERNEYDRSVLLKTDNGKSLWLTGTGASPEGNKPFLDKFNINTKKSDRIWQSKAPYYERIASILDIEKGDVITWRESVEEPPNYYLKNINKKGITPVTTFPNPYKSLDGIHKELIKYKRKDGVEMTATLYLPAGYDKEKDGRLPVFMWAYPREFKSKDAAGQVTDSPYEFIRLYYGSPLFWVTQGYAILDDFSMPIIGEGEEEPNETFVEQLVSGAEAAIDKVVEMGIGDRDRLAVGGHSYGAFMTANLLAHSDLFAAGIARSGAYNRTLTPFGFQAEERTFWEAPETYFKMSPFMAADKIKEPLLLIHGEADNNSGTYPMQSERFYGALKGHGAQVRLVMLPHESHGYRAEESVLHMLWEMTEWLDKHVKNKSIDK